MIVPYVMEKDRGSLKPRAEHAPTTPGELNFQVTSVALDYLRFQVWCNGLVRYADLANVLSALEGAKLEIYRRFGAALEDAAIKANGDLPQFKELLALPQFKEAK